MLRYMATLAIVCCSVSLMSCSRETQKHRVAFVTNNGSSFWAIASKGVADAAAKYDLQATVHMPNGAVEQKSILQDLRAKQVDGIAISPLEPDNQTELLDTIAEHCFLITHDSDAPKSKRLAFVGVDNYEAGQLCAQLIAEALPQGGEICLFVGQIGQDNARRRRQGLIDGLLGRERDDERNDPPSAPIRGDKYTILTTLTDQADEPKAKANAADAIARFPKLACMVGLYAYNTPCCLEALKQAGKLGEIEVVAFDEDAATLAGIRDGYVHGTVVQDPYNYGYKSVELLNQLIQGDDSAIPASKHIVVPARQIRRNELDAFWADLKKKIGED